MWNILIPAITSIIDKLIPDADEAAKAKSKILEMQLQGDLDNIGKQLEINAREAQHPSIFVSGWRPAAGWCGVSGLAYTAIIYPMVVWLARIKGLPEPPMIESDLLWAVLTGLLGLGGLRSIEKAKGVSK